MGLATPGTAAKITTFQRNRVSKRKYAVQSAAAALAQLAQLIGGCAQPMRLYASKCQRYEFSPEKTYILR